MLIGFTRRMRMHIRREDLPARLGGDEFVVLRGEHHPNNHVTAVNAILSMGSALGLEVVAEGVETEEQNLVLKRLGCQYVQGYYYTSPCLPGNSLILSNANLDRTYYFYSAAGVVVCIA
ncbi:MAG: EAL domain-containing protein, partial [Candidatus Thiodiazotropha sp.]